MECITQATCACETRIMLIGKTGSGVSASANTILGQNFFKSAWGFSSVTKSSQCESEVVENRTIRAVDTPNFFNSTCADIQGEVEKGVKWSNPGLHALLLVFSLNTKQDADVVEIYKKMFGKEVLRYTIVLFTHGDELQNTSFEEMIGESRELSSLVDACGGRYHVFNNKNPPNRVQVSELLHKIDRMVADNGNSCYTLQMFRNAQFFSVYRKRMSVLMFVIIIFMEVVNAQNKQSVHDVTLTQECLTGVSAAVLGAVSVKVWAVLWRNNLGWIFTRLTQNSLNRIKIGSTFALATIAIAGYYTFPSKLSTRLLTRLAWGVAGSIVIFWDSLK